MRRLLRSTVLLGTLALGASGSALAQDSASTTAAPVDSVKAELIRSLLTQSHAIDIAMQTMEASVTAQRKVNPAIPAEFWDRFLDAAHERKGELETLLIQIYDRHFTADELRQLIAFYQTPIGQKLMAAQPAIAQEGMAAGQVCGRQLGAEVGAKMGAEANTSP